MPNRSQKALTLPEVLVLLVVVCLMLGLLLPGLLRGRDKTRINHCQARLERLIQSVHEFESLSGRYPSGAINPTGPIANEPVGMHHSWIAQILPFIEEQATFAKIDPNISVYDEKHRSVRSTYVGGVVCPASPQQPQSAESYPSSYAACYHDAEAPLDTDNNGVFFLNSTITKEQVDDGLRYTLFLGEIQIKPNEANLGWMSGTRSVLRNTGTLPNPARTPKSASLNADEQDTYVMGGFGSWHVGISHIAMGDGQVTKLSDSVDPIVYRQLGNRHDGTQLTMPNNASADEVDDAADLEISE